MSPENSTICFLLEVGVSTRLNWCQVGRWTKPEAKVWKKGKDIKWLEAFIKLQRDIDIEGVEERKEEKGTYIF